MRVVSCTCSNTEIVHALGCDDLLVGCDDHSDWPPELVARLPRVGPDLGIDVERVRALEPDLVLASLTVPGHERVVESLVRAGLRVLAPEPVSLADVVDDVRTIAAALGVAARGEALARRLESAWAPREGDDWRPRLLVEWWPKPVIVPGRASWVTELVALAGGENPLALEPVKSRPLDFAAAAALHPDAVVISWCGVRTEKYRREVVLRRPGWEGVPAVVNGHVFPIPEAFLGRPGPRLVQGLEHLAKVVARVRAGGVTATAAR